MEKIKIQGQRTHNKASERYIDVTFIYEDGKPCDVSIPIEYRRTGTDIKDELEIQQYILKVYEHCGPQNHLQWLTEQEEFWRNKPRARVTKPFFDALAQLKWNCTSCDLPSNPNQQRRIQDLKEMGYTIATDINKFCNRCRQRRTHLILLPSPRGGISGYETWSPNLRKKIVLLLRSHDVYEDKIGNKDNLLPDHKFPEIRWDANTRRISLGDLIDQQIISDFQLMSNQRNQQKREVCRNCHQTGERGYPFGIKFYYEGDENWPTNVPKRGKSAERGCCRMARHK